MSSLAIDDVFNGEPSDSYSYNEHENWLLDSIGTTFWDEDVLKVKRVYKAGVELYIRLVLIS